MAAVPQPHTNENNAAAREVKPAHVEHSRDCWNDSPAGVDDAATDSMIAASSIVAIGAYYSYRRSGCRPSQVLSMISSLKLGRPVTLVHGITAPKMCWCTRESDPARSRSDPLCDGAFDVGFG